ncbi:MAG TPA: hypothetical protein VGK21_18330 [Candidatus Angelobacter sp.]
MRLLSKLFWRIIVPFCLALILTAVEIFGRPGGGGGGIHFHNWASEILAFLYILLAVISFAVTFRNTLRWGKEAEEFESELREADEIEKERRRRADWIER